MFAGRKEEINALERAYTSNKSEFVVVYGRRRVGKSSLISRFSKGKPYCLSFEAIEGEQTKAQIVHFTETLRKQTNDPLLADVAFPSWENVFTYLTERIVNERSKNEKLILFIDELPWMAAGRGKLVGLLKYYWDNHWKDQNVMLILCGSVAAFMVKRVMKSKALYGRITLEILLRGLQPHEAALLFRNKRSNEEILKYQLIFGGIPKYIEEIDLNQSFNQNLNRLCFSKTSPMCHEIERIFYSQFKESRIYLKIVELLNGRICTMDEISTRLAIASGGGLKLYLNNLEDAEIIHSFVPFGRRQTSKLRKYTLTDEFMIFFFKYMQPHLPIITETATSHFFETLTKGSFNVWLGFAFERFCTKHAMRLAALMGFGDEVLTASPYFEKGDRAFQIDLLYERSDKVITICEIKHHNTPLTTKIIPEMERKSSLFRLPRGFTLEKALVSLYGPDKALRDACYFNHYIVLDDIIGSS